MFWAIELVRDRETREPLVPFNAAGADADADGRARGGVQGSAACGRSPTSTACTSCRRCTISDDDVREGLAIIDEALDRRADR